MPAINQESSLYFNGFQSGYYPNRPFIQIPPGGGADVVIDSQNFWHTERGTWKKRDAAVQWSTDTTTEKILGFFSYNDNSIIRVIADEYNSIAEWTTTARDPLNAAETGSPFSKAVPGAKGSYISVGDTMYVAIPGERGRKRIQNGDLKEWGIDFPTAALTYSLVAAGTHNSKIGYQYVYVYKDSEDGHISSASPILTLGVATPADYTFNNKTVRLTVTYSTQDRVDFIDIYRTTDGGSNFFFLAEIANNTAGGTVTYDDAAEDDALNTDLEAPLGNVNDPPQEFTVIAYHAGRVWGLFNDKLYYATGPETFNGVPEESFDPTNSFKFPNNPNAIATTSQGLLVFTDSDTWLIRGSTKEEFARDILRSRLGIISNPKNITTDGDTVYLISSFGEILRITDSIENIGIDVGTGSTSDPTVTQIILHRKGTTGAVYLLASDSDPGAGIIRFNLATETWSGPSIIVDIDTIVTAIGSVQTDTSTFDLLIATFQSGGGEADTCGILRFSDIGTQDYDTLAATGVSYGGYVRFGSLVLCPPGDLVWLTSIFYEAYRSGAAPSISVLLNDEQNTISLGDQQEEPPIVTETAPASFYSRRIYLTSEQGYTSNLIRHCQITVSFAEEEAFPELWSLGLVFRPWTK